MHDAVAIEGFYERADTMTVVSLPSQTATSQGKWARQRREACQRTLILRRSVVQLPAPKPW